MQIYEVKTMRDYSVALQDIILHQHVGIIKASIPGYGTGCYMHYTVPLRDVTLIYSLQHSFVTPEECAMLPIETLLTRFTFNGIYANGIIYNPKYNIFPYPTLNSDPIDTGCLPIIRTNELLPKLNQQVDEYIWNKVKIMYPTHASIPSQYWYDCEEVVKETAMKYVLGDKDIDEIKEPPKNPKLEELRVLIRYHQAIVSHTEDAYVKKIAEELFSEEAIKKKYLFRLSSHYQLLEAIKSYKANEDPEDTLYKKIRTLYDSFIKNNPNAKNVKVIIKGRVDLLDTYFSRHHPDFIIDGREIELTLDAKRFYSYENTRKFNIWNFTIIRPKVKQEYSNRNENYLEDFLPSDILSISYGKKIIYQVEP